MIMAVDWWELNLRHLRAVAETARLGSVSAASEAVHLSQPALTQGIAKVERLLEARLFVRRSDGMAATREGRLLARRIAAAGDLLAGGFDATGRARPGSEGRLTTAQVRAFLAFAGAGSFAGAAAASGIAQPTLHRAVGEVERLSGLDLYARAGRGVRLTAHGLAVARGMRRAVAELAAGISEVAGLSGREVGAIRIGAMPLARAALVPAAVDAFRARRPDIGVEIVDGAYPELSERLKDGELDFLVGALRGESADPALAEEPLFDDPLSIVARPGHPLARGGAAEPGRLADFPWIVARPDTPHHRQWRLLFEEAGIAPPANPILCGSVMAIRELLELGDYLALLSRDQVQRPLSVGHLVLLGRPIQATRRTIGLTTRADFRPTPLQGEMLDLVRSISVTRNSTN